jgi:hypothetical protein
MIDDDPMTDQRKAAIVNATNAQTNVNQVVHDLIDAGAMNADAVMVLSATLATVAQVFATLDLADAIREQTAAVVDQFLAQRFRP